VDAAAAGAAADAPEAAADDAQQVLQVEEVCCLVPVSACAGALECVHVHTCMFLPVPTL
jgi:hypothetical protein